MRSHCQVVGPWLEVAGLQIEVAAPVITAVQVQGLGKERGARVLESPCCADSRCGEYGVCASGAARDGEPEGQAHRPRWAQVDSGASHAQGDRLSCSGRLQLSYGVALNLDEPNAPVLSKGQGVHAGYVGTAALHVELPHAPCGGVEFRDPVAVVLRDPHVAMRIYRYAVGERDREPVLIVRLRCPVSDQAAGEGVIAVEGTVHMFRYPQGVPIWI